MPYRRSASGLLPGVCLILSSLLMLPAGAADSGPQPEVPKAWPKWMKKAMKKESRRKKAAAFESEGGEVAGTMLGKLVTDPVPFEGGWYVGSDVGSDEPVTCYIYTQHRNLANTVEGIQGALIEGIVENNGGQLKERVPYYVNSGVVGDLPFVTSEWLYTVDTQDGVKVGLTKVRGAQKGGATLVCAHPDLGYRATFARHFERFITDARVELDRGDPYYREVIKLTLAEQPAGFATATFTRDEEGDTRIDLVTAMLMRVDARTIVTSDSLKLEYSTPWGTLINAYDFTVQNGELSSELALAYDDDKGWHVEGKYGGKDIAVDLEATEAPLSALGQMYAIRAALEKETGRSEFQAWVSDADPSKFLGASVQIGERGDSVHGSTLALGPIVIDARVDDAGSTVDATVPLGANTLTMERVVVQGSVPDPQTD